MLFFCYVLLFIIPPIIKSTVMCLTPKTQLKEEKLIDLKLDNDDLVDNCDYVDWDHLDTLNKEIKNKLNILQLIIRGIKSKYYDLLELINKLNSLDIIILCETWLKASDAQPHIVDYEFIGIPRANRKGGGVGFLVNKGIKVQELPKLKLDNETVKSIFVEIKGNHHNMVMGSIYCPPNTPVNNFLNSYQKCAQNCINISMLSFA